MESDPTRMCALLVGLPDVTVIGVGDWPHWLRIEVISLGDRPVCACGTAAHRHGVREVVLVDLPCFGRATRLVVHKQRWRCPICRRSWTGQDPAIASSRCAMTARAARWATLDLSSSYRTVFDTMLPTAVQVADPFHVVRVRHEALCIRRRVRDPPGWAVAAVR